MPFVMAYGAGATGRITDPRFLVGGCKGMIGISKETLGGS